MSAAGAGHRQRGMFPAISLDSRRHGQYLEKGRQSSAPCPEWNSPEFGAGGKPKGSNAAVYKHPKDGGSPLRYENALFNLSQAPHAHMGKSHLIDEYGLTIQFAYSYSRNRGEAFLKPIAAKYGNAPLETSAANPDTGGSRPPIQTFSSGNDGKPTGESY